MFVHKSRRSRLVLLAVATTIVLVTYYLLAFPAAIRHQIDAIPAVKPEKSQKPSELRQLCDATTWTPGLYIQCHSYVHTKVEGTVAIHGGLNNVRNRIQSCLRVAIDAGAGVILPQVATRSQTALKKLGAGTPVPASRFWDIERMEATLAQDCGQLEIRHSEQGIQRTVVALKRQFQEPRYWKGTFGGMVTRILEEGKIDVASISKENMAMVNFGDTFLSWDYEKSKELNTIRKDLFNTLYYNRTLVSISSQILSSPQLKDGFIGIHFRASSDWPWSFGNPEQQMKLYVEELEKIERKNEGDMRTLYVSCGNQTRLEELRQKVEPLGYKMWDKWSLLANDPKTLAVVDALMFDEKGAVEFELLLRSKFFMGPFMSSMSQLIAYARSVNDDEGFFEEKIFPGSTKDTGENGAGMRRTYPVSPAMKGDDKTKLMIVNGEDIMSCYP